MSVESDPGFHWFCFPSPMIGRENPRHPLNQSETKRQVIETCSSIFPQALGS